jgi:hypothetical protein
MIGRAFERVENADGALRRVAAGQREADVAGLDGSTLRWCGSDVAGDDSRPGFDGRRCTKPSDKKIFPEFCREPIDALLYR